MKINHPLAALTSLVSLSLFARAQDISDVFPVIKTLPAPASIQEGMRVSYYGSAGDIPNDDFEKWPSDDGGWQYGTAPSGHGYTQVDVIALSQGVAALSVQGWQYSDWTGPLIPIRGGQRGLLCYPGGGDWWIHPQALAQMQELHTADLTIIRVSQMLNGTSYPAIRIQRTLPESRQAVVYDLQTGRLLFKNSAVQTGNTTFASQIYYEGTRQLPFGGGARLPSWLKPGLQLDYRGTYTAYVIGNPPFSLPLDALLQVQLAGDRWFYYDQTTTLASINGLPPTIEKASLVGGGATVYVPPQTLKALKLGTILDTDPITGAQLAVAATGGHVTLRVTVGAVSTTDSIFDAASGVMTAFRTVDSTDPLYSPASDLELVQMPDVNGYPPRLTITRQNGEIGLTCEDGGTRQFILETSEDGGPWHAVGSLSDSQRWNTACIQTKKCTLYRLHE